MTPSTPFERCNHTELYQLCKQAGISVRPNESKQAMIAYLQGDEEVPLLYDEDHSIHCYRHALIDFVRDYWKKLATQITCPMKDLPTNPRPCFGCLDTQVIACIVNNKENEKLIESYRLKRKKEHK